MLRNYFLVAFRNLLHYKAYSSINIIGLAFGLTSGLLILLWIRDEVRYDQFHENAEQLYRVVNEQHYSQGAVTKGAITPGPLAEALAKGYPEITQATRFASTGEKLLAYGDKKFDESNGWYTDPVTFQMFTFPFASGSPATALAEPNAIVITEEMARKYFGNQDALGKTLLLDNKEALTVTGVLKDIPANSHLQFDYLMPYKQVEAARESLRNWGINQIFTYVQLQKTASGDRVSPKIANLIKQNESQATEVLHLQPLDKIHLYSDFTGDIAGQGSILYVRIMAVIALFIVVIACVNFMNLSTARSARRAKEVGLRKAIGARRDQLIGQFLCESVILSMISLLLASLTIALLLPGFNNMTGKELSVSSFSYDLILMFLGVALATGLVAGFYPAFFLSSFRPTQVLKGNLQSGMKGSKLRQVLVIMQFSLASLLIISTLVVRKQLYYAQNKRLGFDKENLLYIPLKGDLKKNYEAFRNELANHPAISGVTATNWLPTYVGASTADFKWPGQRPGEALSVHFVFVDYNYIQTLKMQVALGRDFSRQFGTDSAKAVILNETAVKQMGLKSPVGTLLTSPSGRELTVVGVVKNFHFKSIHKKIEPLILAAFPGTFEYALIKMKPNATTQAMDALKEAHQAFDPTRPLAYKFLDESFDKLYRTEQRFGLLFNWFTSLSVFISCLGLFALSAFATEQRKKEVSVRKLFGASELAIAAMLSRDLLKPVFIGFIIAAPIAWWVMNRWLSTFAYRTNISIWLFLAAGTGALLIALLTVSFESLKSALSKPIDALNKE